MLLLTAWRAVAPDGVTDTAGLVATLPWFALVLAVAVPAAAVLHFLFAGLAVRAATGGDLPLGATTSAQLAAAAANRLVPNGVGGMGVNLRYLRRSGVPTSGALTALAGLSVVGGLTDAAYGATMSAVGPLLGMHGATHELSALAAHGLQTTRQVPWTLIAAGVAGAVLLVLRRRRFSRAAVRQHAVAAGRQLLLLARRPRQLVVMAAASMGTTLVLSVGFAATVHLVAGGAALPPLGALLAIYLVSAALGGAAPVPAVVGVTEAALVGALTLSGVPFATAVLATVVFRGLTFWAPVPIGLVAARRLRSRRLL